MKYQEPPKQFVWEAMPGAESYSDAVRICSQSTNRLDKPEVAAQKLDLTDLENVFRALVEVYGTVFGQIANAVQQFSKDLEMAFNRSVQTDFEVAR